MLCMMRALFVDSRIDIVTTVPSFLILCACTVAFLSANMDILSNVFRHLVGHMSFDESHEIRLRNVS
jgi:hypothetical protein